MAERRGILGQVDPANTTDTLLYVCPADTEAIVSTVFACNRNGAARTIRLRAARAGQAAAALHQYIYYDVNVPLNDTIALTAGITLGPGDALYVYRSASDVNFSAFGMEIDR